MKQPNINFSRDPLALGCYFDPRESFYNVGFDDYGVQWSYDLHSPLKALENFIRGVGTYTEVKFPVLAILEKDPVVIVNYDKKSYEKLIQIASVQNATPEILIQTLLKVTQIQIICN